MSLNGLPENWEVKKLKDACQSISLNGIKIRQKDYLESGKYPVVDQGKELIGGYFNDDSLVVPGEPPYVIFGDHTKIKKFINFKFIPGADGIKVLKPHSEFSPKFFFYLLHVIKIPDKGYARHFQHLEVADIPVPPMDEQERIVAKIEELFSEWDAGVESLKKAQAQLKTYRQAVLKSAFEGKLTNEGGQGEELPDGWKLARLGDVCKTIDSDRGHNYPKKNEFLDYGYCLFLSTKNVREGYFVFDENIFITKEKDEVLRGGKLERNDVVITTRGTLGNVALYDERVPFEHVRLNSGMLILRMQNENLDSRYLMKFITSPGFFTQLKAKQTGTAQPQIPANILRDIKLPFGSLVEQKLVVEEIESRLSVCDKLEETIAASLKQSEALRQSILKQAFEGKLVQ